MVRQGGYGDIDMNPAGPSLTLSAAEIGLPLSVATAGAPLTTNRRAPSPRRAQECSLTSGFHEHSYHTGAVTPSLSTVPSAMSRTFSPDGWRCNRVPPPTMGM
jgi:hypothetical protein